MRRTGDRRSGGRDHVSLAAGLVLIVFGTVLLLDSANVLHLAFGAMAPIAFGALGAILLASGLSRGRGGGDGGTR